MTAAADDDQGGEYGPFRVHPELAKFPTLTEDHLDTLVKDIGKNGLREPILVSADATTIINGRARYIACGHAGVDPKYKNASPHWTNRKIANIIHADHGATPTTPDEGKDKRDTSVALTFPDIPADATVIQAAKLLGEAGIYTLPVKRGQYKNPGSVVGDGWPHLSSKEPEQHTAWFAGTDHGLAIHLGRSGLIALDVDKPDDLPPILLAALDNHAGPMQRTRKEDSPGFNPRRAHYLYRQPPGRVIGNSLGGLAGTWGDVRGKNGVIICAPSHHGKTDEGGLYHWVRTGGIPLLPDELADQLRDAGDSGDAATDTEVTAFLEKHTAASRPELLDRKVNSLIEQFATGGSRHTATVPYVAGAMVEASIGYYPAQLAADQLRDAFVAVMTKARPAKAGAAPERIVRKKEAEAEFAGVLAWGVGQVSTANADEVKRRIAELDAKIAATRAADDQVNQEFADMVSGIGTPPTVDADPGDSEDATHDTGTEEQPPPQNGQQQVDPLDALTTKRKAVLTHADQAAVLARRMMVGRWLWTRELGWLGWDGKRWGERPVEAVRTQVMQFYRLYVDREHDKIIEAAGGVANINPEQKKLLNSLKGLLTKASLDAITVLAGGLVLAELDSFDAHPGLLNVRNGIVDLRTGKLQPHDPSLRMTKMADFDYLPDAAANPDLATLLGCVPDEDTVDWLQVRFGQAATGYPPPDDLLIVFQGGGANGKSTLLGGVQNCLGNYAVLLDDKVLLGDSRGHSTEKTDLWGARFAVCEEVPGGVELNMNMVKKITGSTKIKARRMRMDDMEWEPTHALFLSSNSQPVVKSTDHGTWRRLAKVTFPVRYRRPHDALEGPNDRRGDSRLRDRVNRHEDTLMSAFLAWVVEGARRWYEADMSMPQLPSKVIKDTAAWRSEVDLIMSFLSEAMEFNPRSHVLVEELWDAYKEWVNASGLHEGSLPIFKSRLLEHSEAVKHSVASGRTRNHADLSRRPGRAHLSMPGNVMVLHGLAFKPVGKHGFRVHPGGFGAEQAEDDVS